MIAGTLFKRRCKGLLVICIALTLDNMYLVNILDQMDLSMTCSTWKAEEAACPQNRLARISLMSSSMTFESLRRY
jgi:hypothetical protein